MTVEEVRVTDRAGHRRRVLRLRQHGAIRGDFESLEELAKVIDVGELVQDDDTGRDRPGCNA